MQSIKNYYLSLSPRSVFTNYHKLKIALVKTPVGMRTKNHSEGYILLLDMCARYATLIDDSKAGIEGFSNKEFKLERGERGDGLYVSCQETTSLLEVYASIGADYISDEVPIVQRVWAFGKLSYYVHKKGGQLDFIRFKKKLLELLKNNSKYKDEKFQKICDEVKQIDKELLFDFTLTAMEEEKIKEEIGKNIINSSTKSASMPDETRELLSKRKSLMMLAKKWMFLRLLKIIAEGIEISFCWMTLPSQNQVRF